MVIVKTYLQDADEEVEFSSTNEFQLDEAEVTALLNSEIVTYPRDGGNGYRTSVQTRIIAKNFNLFDSKPHWEIIFRALE